VFGYITHNLVVFDNIVSYIFFVVLLAYVHSRVARPIAAVQAYKLSPVVVTQVVAPTVVLVMGAVVYLVNVPAILAAQGIIDALRTNDLNERYAIFDSTLTRGSFAQQEIVEQFVQQAITIARTPNVDEDIRVRFLTRAETEIQRQITTKPGDARLHVFAASFYRSTGQNEKAGAELATARTLSPRKQWIILQQGAHQLTMQNNEAARDFFAEAFFLDEEFVDAREYYVASLFLTGATSTGRALIEEAGAAFFDRIAESDFAVNAVNVSGERLFAIELFERRVALTPTVAQTWASLAFLYYQNGENDKAIEVLNRGAVAVPSFKRTADCIGGNITKGLPPETPCN
jgi:tetratricopeptide (TPR) repeat protein